MRFGSAEVAKIHSDMAYYSPKFTKKRKKNEKMKIQSNGNCLLCVTNTQNGWFDDDCLQIMIIIVVFYRLVRCFVWDLPKIKQCFRI